MLRDLQSALEEAEEEIGEQSKERGGDGACEDEGITDEGDAAKNERAETTGADGGGDRCDADSDDGGGSNARKNDGQRKRKTDAKEKLRAGHAHGFGSFKDGRIDAGEANVGVAQDGEQRVEHESDDGGAFANAADEWNGNEETEECETGDGLENAGNAERDGSKRGALND